MIFRKFFSKTKLIEHNELGTLKYVDDGESTYWEIMKYDKMSLACISGTEAGPCSAAIVAFSELISDPDKLFSLLDDKFLEIIKPEYDSISIKDVKVSFKLHSLTVDSSSKYEFGLLSDSKNIFVESFVRGNQITEIYKDVEF